MMPIVHALLFFIFVLGSASCNRIAETDNEDEMLTPDTVAVEPESEPADKFLIRDQQAGPFKIGDELPGPATMMKYQMRVEQMIRITEEGPYAEPVTIIGENGADLIWLKPGLLADNPDYTNTISEITIISDKYKTAKEIGIGSSIKDFMIAYPDARVWYTYVSQMYVLETDNVKVQFLLDKADYLGEKPAVKSEIMPLELKDLNPDGKIKQIRII